MVVLLLLYSGGGGLLFYYLFNFTLPLCDGENECSIASWIKIKTQYGKKYYKSKVYRYIFINCTYLSQHYYSSDEGSKAGTANFVGDHRHSHFHSYKIFI